MPADLTPKVWWISIGINDLILHGCKKEIVVLGILRVVEQIQYKQPKATIVINSLLPVQSNLQGMLEGENLPDCNKRLCGLWPSIVQVNQQLKTFASSNKGVDFFNADDVFVKEREDGKYLDLSLMEDPIHPNAKGHRRWTKLIKHRLRWLLR